MAKRLIPARFRYVDSAGDAMSGYKLFFYKRDTTDAKDTFTDEALTAKNTNPVVLNTQGRPPYDVWGAGDYKMVLTDPTGDLVSPIDTFNPLNESGGEDDVVASITALDAIDASTFEDGVLVRVAGNTGQDGLFYWDSVSNVTSDNAIVVGTGPGQWLRLFEGVVNAKWFGVVGDGVTDDSAAVQAALDATAPGGKLYFPNGTYLLASGVTRSNPITLDGEGIHGVTGTVFKYSGSGTAMTFDTSQNGLRLQDFRLEGSVSGAHGIALQDCQNGMMLDHILVEGFTAGSCLYLDDCWDIDIYGCQFRQSDIGIETAIGATYAVVNNVTMVGGGCADCRIGIDLKCGNGWWVVGVDFSGVKTNGWAIDIANSLTAGTSRACEGNTFIPSYIENGTGETNAGGVRIGYNATIGTSVIANNAIITGNFDTNGDYIYVDYAQDTLILNPRIGGVTGGKASIRTTANALRTRIDWSPRNNVVDGSSTTKYDTNDVQTLVEAQGNFTAPQRSMFQARLSADILNVTGNGVYTLVADTEIYDTQSEYNTGTGVFTAQKAGKYHFNCGAVILGAGGMTSTQGRLITSNRTYDLWLAGDVTNSGGAFSMSGAADVDMDAGDTAYLTIEVTGLGSNTADIEQSNTYFAGHLIG